MILDLTPEETTMLLADSESLKGPNISGHVTDLTVCQWLASYHSNLWSEQQMKIYNYNNLIHEA